MAKTGKTPKGAEYETTAERAAAAAPKAKSETKAPAPTLPASLVAALPSSKDVMKHVQAMEKALPGLIREVQAARKSGAVSLARSYVVYKRVCDRMEEMVKPYNAFRDVLKGVVIPEQFEQAGIPNVTIDEGFRIGLSTRILASIIPDKKEEAYQWLRDNDLGDIIGETVNASTLSATAKSLVEDQNKELPEDLFKVAYVPNTSVTKTK